ncbi:AAA domain-containing protein [Pseudobutyrivibrio xylanivorans]|uniref:Superfamily I DNA and/or RNA helicase n=1 Tax=Pseudobutyrivibrio xylanivorans TaxID=185007 RepID=A0A1G5S289_PSEXY|nr:AAA domain-containing protein [Pseudobutyrivibrio xylanivorans]SCZ80505.1 Superfamily I DNA and/or RNA helicase [Pseudobutyrivibrio xylanivorans]
MLDAKRWMIVIKDEIKTNQIANYNWNKATNKHDITFSNGKTFSYLPGNVIVMREPKVLKPENFIIWTTDGQELFDIDWIYEFSDGNDKYWHIEFKTYEYSYKKSDLIVRENCLATPKTARVFDYLKDVSGLSKLPGSEGEGKILKKYYENINFVSDSSALYYYLNGDNNLNKYNVEHIIFPFGCNKSQYKAVRNALENQISVIQGPPGTGKTQTILNIIANLLLANKSIIVVSNNNSATANVLEKLAKEKYGMDFLVAALGSVENKTAFIESQTGRYPDLSSWRKDVSDRNLLREIDFIATQLQKVYQLKEDIANLKLEKHDVELEAKHFEEFYDENVDDFNAIKIRGNIPSEKVMMLWLEIQDRADRGKNLSLFQKLRSVFVYGIANWDFYKQDLSKIISVLQRLYYKNKLIELENELSNIERELENSNAADENILEKQSLEYLKSFIEKKYDWKKARVQFDSDDLYKNSESVLREYPIVLSTTFSARNSLNSRTTEYDYVIMDEASQVDVATGALALSCAKNAVIVGDLKQLSNVVTPEVSKQSDVIFEGYSINEAYDFGKNSFLKSVTRLLKNVPSTLLREHYRCNPLIIEFCNRKFYDNELVIMTEDNGARKPLKVYKTTPGNHTREGGLLNERQIDVIKEEVLPELNMDLKDIGVVAPYNKQVDALKAAIPGIDAATVHKYQGREKDAIIICVVDDYNQGFMEDSYLLNVAISRAKDNLAIVISGNTMPKTGNIPDLVSYIQYNNMEVVESKVYSVFDYLYKQYAEQRWQYLKNRRKISQYDSENLMYALLQDILKDYTFLDVSCFTHLYTVIKDISKLTDDEARYAFNPGTHLDFLLYKKLGKEPFLAIEVDGFNYHKVGTAQHERDLKKNSILEKCDLPLLRLPTNGSGEREKIIAAIEVGMS